MERCRPAHDFLMALEAFLYNKNEKLMKSLISPDGVIDIHAVCHTSWEDEFMPATWAELGDVWHKLGVEGTDGEFRPTLYFLADRGYIVLCESNEVYPDSLFNFQTRVGLKNKRSASISLSSNCLRRRNS